jgi:hypothetical protein
MMIMGINRSIYQSEWKNPRCKRLVAMRTGKDEEIAEQCESELSKTHDEAAAMRQQQKPVILSKRDEIQPGINGGQNS